MSSAEEDRDSAAAWQVPAAIADAPLTLESSRAARRLSLLFSTENPEPFIESGAHFWLKKLAIQAIRDPFSPLAAEALRTALRSLHLVLSNNILPKDRLADIELPGLVELAFDVLRHDEFKKDPELPYHAIKLLEASFHFSGTVSAATLDSLIEVMQHMDGFSLTTEAALRFVFLLSQNPDLEQELVKRKIVQVVARILSDDLRLSADVVHVAFGILSKHMTAPDLEVISDQPVGSSALVLNIMAWCIRHHGVKQELRMGVKALSAVAGHKNALFWLRNDAEMHCNQIATWMAAHFRDPFIQETGAYLLHLVRLSGDAKHCLAGLRAVIKKHEELQAEGLEEEEEKESELDSDLDEDYLEDDRMGRDTDKYLLHSNCNTHQPLSLTEERCSKHGRCNGYRFRLQSRLHRQHVDAGFLELEEECEKIVCLSNWTLGFPPGDPWDAELEETADEKSEEDEKEESEGAPKPEGDGIIRPNRQNQRAKARHHQQDGDRKGHAPRSAPEPQRRPRTVFAERREHEVGFQQQPHHCPRLLSEQAPADGLETNDDQIACPVDCPHRSGLAAPSLSPEQVERVKRLRWSAIWLRDEISGNGDMEKLRQCRVDLRWLQWEVLELLDDLGVLPNDDEE